MTLGSAALAAQDTARLLLPFDADAVEGNSATSYPWGTTNGCRVMQAYGADLLAQPRSVRITGIAFRPDGALDTLNGGQWGIRIDLSTSRQPADGLSRTFDDNHGSDRVKVFSGVVEALDRRLDLAPHPFHLRIAFDRPFTWDPGCGPLLVDVISSGQSASELIGLTDGQSNASGTFGRIVHTTDAGAAVANFPASGTQRFAPTLELTIDTSVVPRSAATNEGSSGKSIPLASNGRFQTIYEGRATGLRGYHRIHSLAWRTDDAREFRGGRTYALRVTLSSGPHGLAATRSPAFANNHGEDAKIVFEGDWTPPPVAPGALRPSPFSFEVRLQRPFDYNAEAGCLVVDLQVFSQSGGSGATLDADRDPDIGGVNDPDPNATTGALPFGLVLRIGSARYRTLPAELDDGAGTPTLTAAPWDAHPARVLTAYDATSLHVCRPILIERLSWMPERQMPPVAYAATIDLSTGTKPPLRLGSDFDGNHGADRVRAFDGTISLPRVTLASPNKYRLEVELDRPFLWDPSRGPLIVDLRKTAGDGGPNAQFAAVRDGLSYRVAAADPNATDGGAPSALALAMRLGGDACGAQAIPTGAGCPGGAFQLAPSNSTLGLPQTGNLEFAFRLFDGPGGQPAAMLTGRTAQTTNLGFLGLPACNLHLRPDFVTLTTTTDGSGAARIDWPIARDPSFAGVRLFTQWFCLDPLASGGATVSNGLELRFCHRR